MREVKAEKRGETERQSSLQNPGDRSATIQPAGQSGPHKSDGLHSPQLFSLAPREFSTDSTFDKCWWISAPRTAH
jgi:hypothetical protein